MKWLRLLWPFGKPGIEIEITEVADSDETKDRAESKEKSKEDLDKERQKYLEMIERKNTLALSYVDQINSLAKYNCIKLDGDIVFLEESDDGVYSKAFLYPGEKPSFYIYVKRSPAQKAFDDAWPHVSTRKLPVPKNMVVESPPEWISIYHKVISMTKELKRDLVALKRVEGALVKGEEVLAMLFPKSDSPLPIVKFYEDQMWITHGWEGPAIVAGGEDNTAIGKIPLSTTLFGFRNVVLAKANDILDNELFKEIPLVYEIKAELLMAHNRFIEAIDRIEFPSK